MSDVEVVEAEEVSAELAVRDAPPPATLFRTDDPAEVVGRATATADALMAAIRAHDAGKPSDKRLVSVISGKEYPKVECWTLLGTMLGVFPKVAWTHKLENGWEARVEAVTKDGAVIGAAEAMCTRSEPNWASRTDNALRSMAQTRATSKALRGPLGFVVTLAGLEATPSEEMTDTAAQRRDVPAPDPPPAGGRAVQFATKEQKQRISIVKGELLALNRPAEFSEPGYRKFLKTTYDVTSIKDLTEQQATELETRLRQKKKLMLEVGA